ncbi:hypothetical protein PIB30_083298, partial [Stylosanthes scabra]|nr:hypothetical protein [Stylosanthes scabra]
CNGGSRTRICAAVLLEFALSVLLHFYETKSCNSSRQNMTASFTCLLGRKSALKFNPLL